MPIAAQIARINAYIRDGLLPYVTAHGFDADLGGFQEFLNPDGPAQPAGDRRVTICGRNLFVFSRAAVLDDFGQGEAIAKSLFHDLTTRFWDRAHDGCVFTISPGQDAQPVNRDKDLYGLAFALFGLAELRRNLNFMQADPWIARLDQVLGDHMALPGGWYSAKAAGDWSNRDRKLFQNPHMHLLEAAVAAFNASGSDAHRTRIFDLMHLFETKLLDPATGAIGEFKDEHGHPTADGGHIMEPGHHFEWAWLIGEAGRAVNSDQWAGLADLCFGFGLRHGLDPVHGGVFDAVTGDGAILRDTKRIWPLTEYIKAEAVRMNSAGPSESERAYKALIGALDFLFAHYLLPNGGWRERLTRDLVCYDDRMPATTPYHIYLALIESRRALSARVA
jgi:mannose-6-phosphate isomerase